MKTRWMILAWLALLCGMAQAAFVTIGNAGNSADPLTGFGAVGYIYRISTTEVTIAEFQASGAGNGNENYWNDGTRTVGPSAPVVSTSLYEAMKYCNWRTSGNVNNGAYHFSDVNYTGTDRASAITTYGTVYVVPTEDEWYKAAYYTGNSGDFWSLYANGTDTVPVHGTTGGWNYCTTEYVNPAPNFVWVPGSGGLEQNGTHDMMGNVWEWLEDPTGVFRGGAYADWEVYERSTLRNAYYSDPNYESNGVGFRIAAVGVIPEPTGTMMFLLCVGFCLIVHRTRNQAIRHP